MHGNRTRLRQELEKQRQDLERKRDEDETWKSREGAGVQQSASMEVPVGIQQQQPQVSVEVPSNVLEVRTKLQNPTSYHVNAVQKQQVHRYLSSQDVPIQSHSAPSQNATTALRGVAAVVPPRNMTSVSMQQDPLLSGGALNASPMRPSSLNPSSSPCRHKLLFAASLQYMMFVCCCCALLLLFVCRLRRKGIKSGFFNRFCFFLVMYFGLEEEDLLHCCCYQDVYVGRHVYS